MKGVFFETLTEQHNVRVVDTITSSVDNGVTDAPAVVGTQGLNPMLVVDSTLLAYRDGENEPTGKRYLDTLYTAPVGLTPGGFDSLPPGSGANDVIQSVFRCSDQVLFWMDNQTSTNLRIAIAKIGVDSAPQYNEYSAGSFPAVLDVNQGAIAEFEGGAKRFILYPDSPDSTVTISTELGSGALGVAGTVEIYTGMVAETPEAADELGLINAARIWDALTAFGTPTSLRCPYVFTWEGSNDGMSNQFAWMAGLEGNQATVCAPYYPVEFGPVVLRSRLVTFDAGRTTVAYGDIVDFEEQTEPPYLEYIVPAPMGEAETAVFWTGFKRTEEQP